MKRLYLFCLFILPGLCAAQDDSRISWGVGLGNLSYYTNLYYYRFDATPSRYNYPEHKLTRWALIGTVEKASVWRAGPVQFDLTGEFILGFAGKSTGLWLPEEETISTGGLAIGLGAGVRAGYPIANLEKNIMPFISAGPQFMAIYNNGDGLGKNFASNDYYYYGEGWTEYIALFTGSLGAAFEITGGYTVIPEFRFGIIGISSTNWEPNEEGVEMESTPGLLGISVKVTKSF